MLLIGVFRLVIFRGVGGYKENPENLELSGILISLNNKSRGLFLILIKAWKSIIFIM